VRFARVIAGLALALSGPLASAAPAVERLPHLRPPDAGSEEAGLWDATDKAERAARTSGELDADPELNAYVKHVLCKVAQEYCDDLRLYIMDRPFFNATTAPNGYVEVWSGLLLRARSEAELAFVLAHETTHFARNHSLAAERHFKDQANGAMALGLILSAGMMAGGAYAGVSASTIGNANATITGSWRLATTRGLRRASGKASSTSTPAPISTRSGRDTRSGASSTPTHWTASG